jgi:hypothetical protein
MREKPSFPDSGDEIECRSDEMETISRYCFLERGM